MENPQKSISGYLAMAGYIDFAVDKDQRKGTGEEREFEKSLKLGRVPRRKP